MAAVAKAVIDVGGIVGHEASELEVRPGSYRILDSQGGEVHELVVSAPGEEQTLVGSFEWGYLEPATFDRFRRSRGRLGFGLEGSPGRANTTLQLDHESPSPVARPTVSPNPFNPRTKISYSVEYPAHVRIDVYDLRGSHVATPLDAFRGRGVYESVWSGRDDDGDQVASGTYVFRVKVGSRASSVKATLLK